MNDAKFYPFDLTDLNMEYENFISEICKQYKVHYRSSERVYREVIQAHVLALLNERTYSMFNSIADDWKSMIIDMLFPNQFHNNMVYDYELERYLREDEVISRIANFDRNFERLNSLLSQMLREAIDQNDPMFTIWAVEYGQPILRVEAVGDYRIEQWHKDYGVSRSTTRETLTIDLDKLSTFVKRVINFRGLAGVIQGTKKADILAEIIRNCVSYFLSNKANHQRAALDTLALICSNEDMILAQIKHFFDLEFKMGIEHVANFSSISYFTVYGNSVVIHFDSRIRQSRTVLERAELEAKVAENNMDYVPLRQR